MPIVNFKKETLDFLHNHGKSIHDVHVIIDGTRCPFDYFIDLAKDINYDNGYGIPCINSNVYIIGDDWWMSRHEYDGSEWWKFNKKPMYKNDDYKELTPCHLRL